MNKELSLWIRRILCWPMVFSGYAGAAIIYLLFGKSIAFREGILLTVIKKNSWLTKTKWFAGLTLGHGVILVEDADEKIWRHELIHVEQLEAATVGGLMTGLLCLLTTLSLDGLASLFVAWTNSAMFVYLGGGLIALIRGKSWSPGNFFEESAYKMSD